MLWNPTATAACNPLRIAVALTTNMDAAPRLNALLE